MKIDTLVLSGGSTKVPAFIGAFRALKEHNILNDTLDGITHIITCSVGMMYALIILLHVSDPVLESIMQRLCFSEILDIENIHINNLLFDLGLFDNSKITSIISTILREKYDTETMSMQELYDMSGIKLTAKVCNNTKACVEYFSHENEPDLSITKLLQMTTAIPLFFKPIPYKGCLYVDGGTAGGFATEIAGDNYLGIQLKGPSKAKAAESLLDEIPLIGYILQGLTISCEDTSQPDCKKIVIPSPIHFINFKLSLDEKQTLIDDGYRYTIEHIKNYTLTNDDIEGSLQDTCEPDEPTEPCEDTDPIVRVPC
jgi:hypothetical protein